MKGLDCTPTPDPADRRHDVRISAPADLVLELSDRRIRTRALDISEGGALIESNLPLVVDAVYQLTFRLGSIVTECTATPVHCRRLDNGRWLAGMKFTPAQARLPLTLLIDHITSRAIQFS
jgi:hypothetical protein